MSSLLLLLHDLIPWPIRALVDGVLAIVIDPVGTIFEHLAFGLAMLAVAVVWGFVQTGIAVFRRFRRVVG